MYTNQPSNAASQTASNANTERQISSVTLQAGPK